MEGKQSWLLFDATAELFKDMALWLPCHEIPLKDPQCERQSGSRMTQLNSHFIVFHCNLIIWCYRVSKWHCLTTASNSQEHRSVLGKICASFNPFNLPRGLHAPFLFGFWSLSLTVQIAISLNNSNETSHCGRYDLSSNRVTGTAVAWNKEYKGLWWLKKSSLDFYV